MLVKGHAEGEEAEYEGTERNIKSRLISVARLPWSKDYDHVIFHESNLPEKHKSLFQSWSSTLPLRFINVQPVFDNGHAIMAPWQEQLEQGSYAFRSPAEQQGAVCWDTTNATLAAKSELNNLGYKSMCKFWFADFLKYTLDYDSVFRIDDDCVLEPDTLTDPDPGPMTTVNSARKMGGDKPQVSIGLAQYFHTLGQRSHSSNATRKIHLHRLSFRGNEHGWSSPYSNIVWFNLTWARQFQWIYDAVGSTECIYHNRWGDHILWGATLRLLGIDYARIPAMRMRYCHSTSSRQSILVGCDLDGCKHKKGLGC